MAKKKKQRNISVALATFNEESHLPRCLESVTSWVDEIIIADGGSTDKTIDIARQFNATIYSFDNPQIFHINKQRAIDRCKGEWILQLDADEVVSKELKHDILTVINKPSINGYWMPRKNYFLGRFLKKGGQYPDYTLRLYRNGKAYLPCKDVHEQAVVDGDVGYLTHPLLHYADETFSRYFLRYKRYTDLLARQLYEQKTSVGGISAIQFLMIKPVMWFLKTYIRHKGFLDSWQGFVFSFYSSLRFPVAYVKMLSIKKS